MSWTAGLKWLAASENAGHSAKREPPPEFHERYLWAAWRSQFEEEHENALEEAGCAAVLSVYMTDFSDEQNIWTSPAELLAPAKRMKQLVEGSNDSIAPLVELYEIAAEDTPPFDEERPARESFLKDLDVLVAMAEWAAKRGMTRIALEIG